MITAFHQLPLSIKGGDSNSDVTNAILISFLCASKSFEICVVSDIWFLTGLALSVSIPYCKLCTLHG